MFRCAYSAIRTLRPLITPYIKTSRVVYNDPKHFSTMNNKLYQTTDLFPKTSLLQNKDVLGIANAITQIPVRTVTKFSLKRGKRKTVKAALRRFYRLDWGGWIRPKVGRAKKLWKKSIDQKRRLRQHVFCNATQSTLLDKMVTKYWKRPKYYVDDPYSPYHTREEFSITRRKPVGSQ